MHVIYIRGNVIDALNIVTLDNSPMREREREKGGEGERREKTMPSTDRKTREFRV